MPTALTLQRWQLRSGGSDSMLLSKHRGDAREKNAAGRNGGIAENCLPSSAGQGMKDWSIHIVGSDLLPSAIEVAERGLYPQSALMGLPPAPE